jgi:hypothetical protein
MAKAPQKTEADVEAPTFTVEEAAPRTESPADSGADLIVLDPSQFQEVVLGSSVAEPLPLTYTRIDN